MAIEGMVWLYWLVCGLATVVLWLNRQQIPSLLSPALTLPQPQAGYWWSISLGWTTTLLAGITYILFTHKEAPGTYHLSDLIEFSLFNGILEQLMFVFWFLLGCWIGRVLKLQQSWKIFALGFVSYSIYSGLIHGLFWVAVLPFHQIIDALGIRLGLLLVMSFLWMWLFWRYRAIMAIIAMHIVVDLLTIGHLHFPWFEAYQWV
jgi:chlorophyllide a hydrolase